LQFFVPLGFTEEGDMKDLGKANVLGVLVDAVDYEAAVKRIISAAHARQGYSVTALAVHGVMTGVANREHRHRLNNFDMVTPDGQPVRWAMNLLRGMKLTDRVYGPTLMAKVCAAAAAEGLPIYLYGSRRAVIDALQERLRERFPGLQIAGAEPSKFRPLTPEEKAEMIERVNDSGARCLFVGLGCPRQEVFAYECRQGLRMPVMAIGAAFDYLAGLLQEPPAWVQRSGLQWAYRWAQEPRRLFKRYALTNPVFVTLLAAQATHVWKPDPESTEAPKLEMLYG
jgi:N-acetylglucosaminyldiphosphoundecaprenol N-acetyl-beta-D-mannosaminyltransferase